MADQTKKDRWHVNRKLLPVKAVYFTFLAAIGDLLPFITIYMKQLGLTATETGIIYGVMPFIAFFVRPVFGIVADKTHKQKLILILCVLMTGVSYCMLLLTPGKVGGTTRMVTSVRTEIMCNHVDSYIRDCDTMKYKNSTPSLEGVQLCDISLSKFAEMSLKNATDVPCEVTCGISYTSIDMHVCFTNNTGMYDNVKCQPYWNQSRPDAELTFSISDITDVVNNVIIGENLTYHGQVCQNYDLKNISYKGSKFWQFQCDAETFFECRIHCNDQYHDTCISFAPKLSETFWIFFVIFLFCNIFFSPVLSLVDAMAYDILGNEKRGHWGRQRLWGTLGFAVFAITSTFIMDFLHKSSKTVDYSISFYIFLGLCIITGIAAYFLEISDKLVCSQVFKNMTILFKYPQVVVFLFFVFIFGIFNSVPEAFLFWYLIDLGSTRITLGLCLVLNCLPEVVMLHYAGKIIKKIGHIICLYIALAAYAVRFLSYSFLTNPWYVLIIEPLHCLTFALFYAAASGYASIITPPGMSSTIQGLIGGLYFGLGKGVGSLFTGKLMDPQSGLGAVWTFRFHALLAVVTLVIYAIVQTLFFRQTSMAAQSVSTVEKPDDEGNEEDTVTADGMLLGSNSVSNE